MKEHPITFTGESVRAILDGRKTQTRRVVNPQPKDDIEPVGKVGMIWESPKVKFGYMRNHWINLKNMMLKYCPYGVHGDRLWVKEEWIHGTCGNPKCHGIATFPPEVCIPERDDVILHPDSVPEARDWCHVWENKRARYMFRWASRLTLELTSVRVERVQEISEEDAQAEGCLEDVRLIYECGGPAAPVDYEGLYASERFSDLWEKINGKRGFGWFANPWVWVLEFRRVESEGKS